MLVPAQLLHEVSNVDEGTKQRWREYALKYLTVLFNGEYEPEQSKQQQLEFSDCLLLVLLLDVFKLEQVVVAGMRPHQQSDNMPQSCIHKLEVEIVIEHQQAADIDDQAHFDKVARGA